MKTIKKQISTFLAAVTLSSTAVIAGAANAQEAANLDELLNQLAQGKVAQTQQNKQREADFVARKSEQDRLLADAVNERDGQIKLSTELEAALSCCVAPA